MKKSTRYVLAFVAAACIIAVAVAVGRRASVRTAGTDVEQLESPAGPGAAEPNLAVGPDGRVYLSWLEPAPDSVMALRFSTFDGARWSAPKTIHAGRDVFVNWADFPSLAVQANGRLAAHWLQRFGGTSYAYDVRIARSTDGGATWGTPMAPHLDRSSTEKGFVSMWREGDGFGAVWLDGRKADEDGESPIQEMMLFATTLDDAGTTGEPTKEILLDARACDCCQTTAAMTSNGPIVAYRDRSANEIRDISVTRRVRNTWTEPTAAFNDNWQIDACPVNGPSIDAAGQRVALAWYTGANDVPRVKVAFSSDAGTTFGAPIIVDEGRPAGRVAAVLLEDGSSLVSWIERTGGDTASVRVRRVREKEGAGAATTVASSTAARASGFPRMALAGEQVYFAWTVPGSPSTVRVARANAGDFR